jgi:hypothetical protein
LAKYKLFIKKNMSTKNEDVDSEMLSTDTLTAGKGKVDVDEKAAVTKRAASNSRSNHVKEVVILKTTSTEGDGNTEMVEKESENSAEVVVKPTTSLQSHWSEAAESQLSELIAHYRSQGYAGPILWELISSKCDYHFTAEQCMSKWYREKTKERYKTQGKKRKEPSTTVKWDAEGTERLNASVELVKSQDFEGAKLWNLVAESLDSKWTAAQCMNKYYRDRHKLQKLKK